MKDVVVRRDIMLNDALKAYNKAAKKAGTCYNKLCEAIVISDNEKSVLDSYKMFNKYYQERIVCKNAVLQAAKGASKDDLEKVTGEYGLGKNELLDMLEYNINLTKLNGYPEMTLLK